MRKIVIIAGLLMGAALLSGTPAKADIGCLCVKLGSPAVCVSTVIACNVNVGGVCVAPCVLEQPKTGKRHHRRHKKK